MGVGPAFSPSAVLQYCHQLCVTFCCLKFTQVKMKKRWRSVEASKGEAMLVLPCASPSYPRVFLAVPILEKGCDKTGEGGRKTSHEFGQIQCADPDRRDPGQMGLISLHTAKTSKCRSGGLKDTFFPHVSSLLRNKEKSRVLI